MICYDRFAVILQVKSPGAGRRAEVSRIQTSKNFQKICTYEEIQKTTETVLEMKSCLQNERSIVDSVFEAGANETKFRGHGEKKKQPKKLRHSSQDFKMLKKNEEV